MPAINVIFQPCKKSFAETHLTLASLSLRLLIFIEIASVVLGLPTKGQQPMAVPTAISSQPTEEQIVSVQTRSRCKCHSRASKRISQTRVQDLSLYQENSDEILQWHLRLSSYLSHNQRSDEVPLIPKYNYTQSHEPSSDVEQPSREVVTELTNSKPRTRQASFFNKRTDISPDENVLGQIILEHTWSVKWGLCESHVCNERTCRRARLTVACVGPCMWYRYHKCPKKFGGFCVTSRDYQGCNSKGPRQDSIEEGKYHIVKIKSDSGTGQHGGQNRKHVSDIDQQVDNHNPNTNGSINNYSNNKKGNVGNPPQNSFLGSGAETSDKAKNCNNQSFIPNNTHQITTQSQPMTHIRDDMARPSKAMEDLMQQVTTSVKNEINHSQNMLKHSNFIDTGVRYVWVISCIVIPTLVFCVGYAIALHLRRRRYLRNNHPQDQTTREVSVPFLSGTLPQPAAPPYSVEDYFASPCVIPGLNFPPPSYEDAMSTTQQETQVHSYSQDRRLVVSCPTVFIPPVLPPPYVESAPIVVPPPERPGHTRLPSYDSAICLHTSI